LADSLLCLCHYLCGKNGKEQSKLLTFNRTSDKV
jgi:hypothetical protein